MIIWIVGKILGSFASYLKNCNPSALWNFCLCHWHHFVFKKCQISAVNYESIIFCWRNENIEQNHKFTAGGEKATNKNSAKCVYVICNIYSVHLPGSPKLHQQDSWVLSRWFWNCTPPWPTWHCFTHIGERWDLYFWTPRLTDNCSNIRFGFVRKVCLISRSFVSSTDIFTNFFRGNKDQSKTFPTKKATHCI